MLWSNFKKLYIERGFKRDNKFDWSKMRDSPDIKIKEEEKQIEQQSSSFDPL